MFKVIDLYNAIPEDGTLFPISTSFDFWENSYGVSEGGDLLYAPAYDMEFVRRYSGFRYYDFLHTETPGEALDRFQADVYSILNFNKKKYEELYRVFVVTDEDDPLTYNYDMTETTGAQHTETKYGESKFTKGEQEDTYGAETDTHKTAPYNTTTPIVDSQDETAEHTVTSGEREDTTGEHTDEYDSDEWVLTRKGNLGVMTATDMLGKHQDFWEKRYSFMKLIFDDICKQLLMIEG